MIRHAELRRQSDHDLLAQMHAMPRDSGERAAICEILVERYTSLVQDCVWPYRRSPEPVEDLMQVGYVGLLKAINNFDPAIGDSLGTYATPCVSGEIKRHFRDKRWLVRVRRSVQELLLAHALAHLRDKLTSEPAEQHDSAASGTGVDMIQH